jgi:hypothetical protein
MNVLIGVKAISEYIAAVNTVKIVTIVTKNPVLVK